MSVNLMILDRGRIAGRQGRGGAPFLRTQIDYPENQWVVPSGEAAAGKAHL
jgi:hypothetical protein